MFLPTLEGQAGQEQKDLFLEAALQCKILGTYAQTEMGHGRFAWNKSKSFCSENTLKAFITCTNLKSVID